MCYMYSKYYLYEEGFTWYQVLLLAPVFSAEFFMEFLIFLDFWQLLFRFSFYCQQLQCSWGEAFHFLPLLFTLLLLTLTASDRK